MNTSVNFTHRNAPGAVAGRGAWLWLALGLVVGTGAVSAFAATAPEWRLATSLYSDVKARAIGDIVTIIIEESSAVNREAKQESAKSTTGSGSASFEHPTVSTATEVINGKYQKVTVPEFGWQFKHDFSGGGQLSSKEDFTSTMSARVLDVLPNGNLLLEGKRTVKLQQENVQVTLTGLVRPKDISSFNTVSSSRLADASIRYDTQGPLVRDQQRGLFTKMVNWLNLF